MKEIPSLHWRSVTIREIDPQDENDEFIDEDKDYIEDEDDTVEEDQDIVEDE